MLDPIIDIVLISLVGLQLGLASALLFYVEKHHRQTWLELGEPLPWNPTPSNLWRSAKFIYLGGALKLWSDPGLRARLVSVWASFAATLVVLIFSKSIGS